MRERFLGIGVCLGVAMLIGLLLVSRPVGQEAPDREFAATWSPAIAAAPVGGAAESATAGEEDPTLTGTEEPSISATSGGGDDLEGHRQRLLAMRGVLDHTGALSPQQIRVLSEFVKDRAVPPDPFTAPGVALKNEAWNRLRNDPAGVSDQEAMLLTVLNDAQQPEVYRNYAVQHLGALLLEGHGGSSGLKKLRECLVETDSSIAGTALIALAHISTETQRMDRAAVDAAAEAMVRSARVAEASQIAALQIVGEWSLGSCRDAAMHIVRDRSRSVCLRMAALRALVPDGKARAGVGLGRLLESDPDGRLQAMIQAMEERSSNRN